MSIIKKFLLSIGSVFGLISASNISEPGTVPPLPPSAPRGASPLLTTKAAVKRAKEAIKTACNNNITKDSISAAIEKVAANDHSITLSTMASALSSLGLDKEETGKAVFALSSTFHVTPDDAASAMVAEARINNEDAPATNLDDQLKIIKEKELSKEDKAFVSNVISADSSGLPDNALHSS